MAWGSTGQLGQYGRGPSHGGSASGYAASWPAFVAAGIPPVHWLDGSWREAGLLTPFGLKVLSCREQESNADQGLNLLVLIYSFQSHTQRSD